jgi:hypothetical protein
MQMGALVRSCDGLWGWTFWRAPVLWPTAAHWAHRTMPESSAIPPARRSAGCAPVASSSAGTANDQDIAWPSRCFEATLSINQAFVQRETVDPKTAAGKRAVDLPKKLVALLRQHYRERPPLAGPDGFEYIVRLDNGAPVDPDNWSKEAMPQIRAAGRLPEGLTMHGLRHTFVSILLAKGVDSKLVSEQIGHTDEAFTRETYQHLLKKTRSDARRALNSAIPNGKPANPKPALRLVNPPKARYLRRCRSMCSIGAR